MHLCCSEPKRCVFCLSRKAESTVVQILTHFACLLRTHQTANFESLSFCSARWDQIRYSAMVNGNNIKSRKIFDVWSHVTFKSQKPLVELIFRRIEDQITPTVSAGYFWQLCHYLLRLRCQKCKEVRLLQTSNLPVLLSIKVLNSLSCPFFV